MDTLAFGYILPTTGWILDLHQLETCAAERTRKITDQLPKLFPDMQSPGQEKQKARKVRQYGPQV